MLRKSSLFVQPSSGFVPLSGGGTLDPNLRDAGPMMRARHDQTGEPTSESLVEGRVESSIGMWQPAVWSPAAAARVRGAEMVVIAAICGYFTFGLGKVLGLL